MQQSIRISRFTAPLALYQQNARKINDGFEFEDSQLIMVIKNLILLVRQNYWMLIGWEAYNYFIDCTAVQLMILRKQIVLTIAWLLILIEIAF